MTLRLAVGVLLMLTTASCIGTREYPEKRYYAIELPLPVASAGADSTSQLDAVRVARFRVSEAFGGSELVYRVDESQYETDYYHEYLRSPASLFTDAVRRRLAAGGLFERVVDTSSAVDTRYTFEGVINAAYGDLRDPDAPAAVLEFQYFVIDGKDDSVILQASIRESEPLANADPAEVVRGLTAALDRAVESVEVRCAVLTVRYGNPPDED
ncbi:MAG: ABC-type transport auxiliary lipoprotein family protein [Planctomycetota bacterium]